MDLGGGVKRECLYRVSNMGRDRAALVINRHFFSSKQL